ncbi:MAG TPA: radical SAM family heme chaperone HemW [Acidiferrobacterales bacterium]|jgi:oxygen-independent coproporphyrinogen-3 oxidase
MFEFSALPPLSLYVHLPWCVRKCPYCDFNSHATRDPISEREYVDALIADLDQDHKRVWNRPVHTVFLGGGTPSLFTPEAVDRLLAALRARLPILADAEITLEANPGTVEQDRFRGYREAGVNRLSIGIQSFDDAKLRALGRIHGRAESLRAAEAARGAGFDNFNFDLMYGLPQQSVDEALGDLGTAMALHPAHLSLYQLTLEPNTLFHAQPPALPDEDALWEMQRKLELLLTSGGYHHYEVSAHARDGRRCRHNLNYWRFGDYLGIGAGAHAKISDAEGITRLWKLRQPAEYLAKAAGPAVIGGERRLTPAEAGFEFMLNALRLTDGFETGLFHQRTGLPLDSVEPALERAAGKGLIERTAEHVRPTETGRRFLNDLQALFLPEERGN